MSRRPVRVVSIAGLCAALLALSVPKLRAEAAGGEASGGGITLHSVTVTLPFSSDPFPPGPGADAIGNNCLACHSAGMVLRQPKLSRAAWEAEVTKMRNVYKAPVAAEDVPAIVDYLVRLQGG